jgi:hypothetical protein
MGCCLLFCTTACCLYISTTNSVLLESTGFLSSLMRIKRGNRRPIPLLGSATPLPHVYIGEIYFRLNSTWKSAPLTSQTHDGVNHTSA